MIARRCIGRVFSCAVRTLRSLVEMYRNHLSPPIFPAAWACDFGEDGYGLWMAFSYQGVRLGFRWIPLGSFTMGSPEGEIGRWSAEVLHPVRLTQGFWLGETTVTQALWQAIMHDNPSHFKGENRPVESISWNDVQLFIQKLNSILQKLQADMAFRLPTEAEWEYACRAGTQTAFNFEGELSLDKVNYRGTWNFEPGKWGGGALQETVEVKSYECNAWGLYEMHGNVWEWCQDFWAERLATEPVINPKGPDEGAGRVVRGGSWVDDGRRARSAVRGGFGADDRDGYLGFRLALGL